MRLCLSLIASIAVLAPAFSFGQTPDILEFRDATKDAFESTAKALDTIESKQPKGKSAGTKKGSTSPKSSANQSQSSGTKFSKIAERLGRPNATNASNEGATMGEQEKIVVGFLGYSADVVYRGALSVIGVAFVICIGVRVNEKVKDYSTGRPSLSRSKIIRR